MSNPRIGAISADAVEGNSQMSPRRGLDPNASFRKPVTVSDEPIMVMVEADLLEKLLKGWFDAELTLPEADTLKWRIIAARKAQESHRGLSEWPKNKLWDAGGTAEDQP